MTTSPLWDRPSINGRNTLTELPICGKVNIRGSADNTHFTGSTAQAFGLALPLEPNTLTRLGNAICYWLGPDEWLLHCPIEEVDSLIESARSRLDRIHHALVDVSDYYTVLRLDGPDSEGLLNKGCPLDLHLSQFPVETCAQTRLGNASILLDRRGKAPFFDIQVRWSHAEYVWDYLDSAMKTL